MAEFGNKDIQTWKDQYPLLNKLISLEEVFWLNPNIEKFELGMKKSPSYSRRCYGCRGKIETFYSLYCQGFSRNRKDEWDYRISFSENTFHEAILRTEVATTYIR